MSWTRRQKPYENDIRQIGQMRWRTPLVAISHLGLGLGGHRLSLRMGRGDPDWRPMIISAIFGVVLGVAIHIHQIVMFVLLIKTYHKENA